MTGTSAHSKKPSKTPSTAQKPEGWSVEDLEERLALIQGHATKFPIFGVKEVGGMLLVALCVPGHKISCAGEWKITPLTESEKE